MSKAVTLALPEPLVQPLDIVGHKYRDGFALHAAPVAIAAALAQAHANRRRLDRAIAWLDELARTRAAQQALGAWPPPDCPCEFHQRHRPPLPELEQSLKEGS